MIAGIADVKGLQESFPDYVKGVMERVGITQQTLAFKIGIEPPAFNKKLNGTSSFLESDLELIGETLKLNTQQVENLKDLYTKLRKEKKQARRKQPLDLEQGIAIAQVDTNNLQTAVQTAVQAAVTPILEQVGAQREASSLKTRQINIVVTICVVMSMLFLGIIYIQPQFAPKQLAIVSAFNRAEEELADGENALAIHYYTEFLNSTPTNSRIKALALYGRGYAWYQEGQAQQAIIDYEQAYKIDPTYTWGSYRLGQAYYETTQDYERAIVYLSIFLDNSSTGSLDKEIALAYYMRGSSFFQQQDYSNSIDDLNLAVAAAKSAIEHGATVNEINKILAWTYYIRGSTYEMLGDKEKAIADFNNVLILPNQAGDSHLQATEELYRLGDNILK